MSESTVDLETATSAPQEVLNELRNSRFNHQRAQELQSALDLRLAQHFGRGNEGLRQQGFIPKQHLTRHLVFDEAALTGLSEMISSTLEEFHRRGQIEEDVLVLVGERQYLDGILNSVVYGSLNPSELIAERRTGGVRFDWQKMIDEIETTREVDTKGIPLSSYEAVGILHTHPPERTSQGRIVAAGRLSPEDEAVLRSFDSQAPGFILGAVVPGVSEHEGTNQILQHTAFWNRSASYTQPVTSLKVLGPPH